MNFRMSKDFHYETNVEMKSQNMTKRVPKNLYPLKLKSGDQAVYTLKLSKAPLPDGYIRCLAASFIVHAPDFTPSFIDFNDFKQLVYGVTLDVIITPEIIHTEESLRKLSPIERECYFEGEKKLRFFKIYSLKNCEEECYSNITFKNCGCVQFNKPRNEQEMLFCKDGISRGTCEIILKNTLDFNDTANFSIRQNCSCLPSCNSVKYNLKYFPIYHNEGNETILNFKMNTEDIVVYKRYQQFTSSDVISYVGGLLGLFAGISILSIVEIFYFVIFRTLTNTWTYFRH